MRRHPYEIRRLLVGREHIRILLWAVSLADSFGITNELREALQSLTLCAGCKQPCRDLEGHTGCFRVAIGETVVSDITLLLSHEHSDHLDQLLRRNSTRCSQWRRALRVAGGYLPEARIRSLLRVQEGRCFYCYASLIGHDGKNLFHRDHYEPLSKAGDHDVTNIVLACPKCNMVKHDEDGDTFRERQFAEAAIKTRDDLRRIQQAVWQWRIGSAKVISFS